MSLIPLSPTANPNASPSAVKSAKGRGWMKIGNFAFCPEKVDGFLRIPEHLKGQQLVAASTQVFFGSHSAMVDDPDGELFQYLTKYREQTCE